MGEELCLLSPLQLPPALRAEPGSQQVSMSFSEGDSATLRGVLSGGRGGV